MVDHQHSPAPLPGGALPDPGLRQAMIDIVRAQRLLEAFYQRIRALLREVEVALAEQEPVLRPIPAPGYDIYAPSLLSLHRPEGWLRRWLALFFTEPSFLGPDGVLDCQRLKVAYLLVNLDPASVQEAELDLVLLHGFTGLSGPLPGWLEAMWNRGQFELAVPPDGWYGIPQPVELGFGAAMNLQIRRVPLVQIPDRAALQREVIDRLRERYVAVG